MKKPSWSSNAKNVAKNSVGDVLICYCVKPTFERALPQDDYNTDSSIPIQPDYNTDSSIPIQPCSDWPTPDKLHAITLSLVVSSSDEISYDLTPEIRDLTWNISWGGVLAWRGTSRGEGCWPDVEHLVGRGVGLMWNILWGGVLAWRGKSRGEGCWLPLCRPVLTETDKRPGQLQSTRITQVSVLLRQTFSGQRKDYSQPSWITLPLIIIGVNTSLTYSNDVDDKAKSAEQKIEMARSMVYDDIWFARLDAQRTPILNFEQYEGLLRTTGSFHRHKPFGYSVIIRQALWNLTFPGLFERDPSLPRFKAPRMLWGGGVRSWICLY